MTPAVTYPSGPEVRGSDLCPLCPLRQEGCGQGEQPRERKGGALCHPRPRLSGVPGALPWERARDLVEGQQCCKGAGRWEKGMDRKDPQWSVFGVCPGIGRAWCVCVWLTLRPS